LNRCPLQEHFLPRKNSKENVSILLQSFRFDLFPYSVENQDSNCVGAL
jgi:hypothetical protein